MLTLQQFSYLWKHFELLWLHSRNKSSCYHEMEEQKKKHYPFQPLLLPTVIEIKKRQRGKVVRGWFCSASLNAITPERLELHFLLEPLTEKTSVADRLVCVSCWMLLVQHILLLFCTPVMTNNACYWTKISLQLSEQSCLAEIRLNDFCKNKMFFLRIRSQLLC